MDGYKAEVYTKPDCIWCERTKELLASRGIPFTTINAVENKAAMIARIGHPVATVPQTFINGKYIGGHEELIRHFMHSRAG